MSRFGYSIIETRTIDYNQFDGRLLKDVLIGEPSFLTCLSCGGCTATCNAGNLIDFNIRKMGLFLRQGDTDLLAKEIDKCMLCGKCTLVCPRDISIRNVIMLMKKGIVEYKNQ